MGHPCSTDCVDIAVVDGVVVVAAAVVAVVVVVVVAVAVVLRSGRPPTFRCRWCRCRVRLSCLGTPMCQGWLGKA